MSLILYFHDDSDYQTFFIFPILLIIFLFEQYYMLTNFKQKGFKAQFVSFWKIKNLHKTTHGYCAQQEEELQFRPYLT